MDQLSEFEKAASDCIIDLASNYPLIKLESGPTSWGKGVYFRFPKFGDKGFDVQLEVFEYGVYPHAEGWHGAPWDVTIWKIDKLCNGLTEFLASVLSKDAYLEICYANEKPYKFTLHHSFEGEMVADTTGLIFYNWFGSRHRKRFVNDVQPPPNV